MSWKEYFTHAIGTAEAAGILIFRSAVVRHATNRPLSVKEFRGFVLSDRYAPVIFINDNDARAAQMFTLAHEAAHVWLNQKGIVDVDFKKKPADLANSIERFCNYVAAEVLVPEVEFRQAWKASTIDLLSRHYRVSTLVILRRAYELGLIPEQQYWRQFEAKYQWYRQRDKPEKKEESKKAKGNFWASFTIRNSARFTRGVVGAVREGRARYSDAATLLGVKTASLERFLLRTGSASQA
jgi:Zn-dependent peptidase ImmA (M78 family)